MVLHEESLNRISAYMKRIGREMTENNRKQAMFPAGAIIMPNQCGTAPGCIVTEGEKAVAVLPGPPHELKDMFDRELAPYLAKRSGVVIESRFLHEFGIGESFLETQLIDLFHSENPTLALYCGAGEVMARITARAATHEAAIRLIEPLEAEIRARLGDAVYGAGVDYDLPHAVYDLLKTAWRDGLLCRKSDRRTDCGERRGLSRRERCSEGIVRDILRFGEGVRAGRFGEDAFRMHRGERGMRARNGGRRAANQRRGLGRFCNRLCRTRRRRRGASGGNGVHRRIRKGRNGGLRIPFHRQPRLGADAGEIERAEPTEAENAIKERGNAHERTFPRN